MKHPYFAVLDWDTETVYVLLYENREDAESYAEMPYDAIDEAKNNRIEDVFDADSCNKYLQENDGYIAEMFEGHLCY